MQYPAFANYPHVSSVTTDPYNSDIATADTISLMQQIVNQYYVHPSVVAATSLAIQGLPTGASGFVQLRDYARAIFYWVKQRLHLTDDESIITNGLHRDISPLGEDLLITPDALLAMPQPMGDCDDYSMLVASMLRVLGIHSKFVTVAANPKEPGVFSHVYVVVYLPDGERMVLDTSHGCVPNWEYSKITRRQEW